MPLLRLLFGAGFATKAPFRIRGQGIGDRDLYATDCKSEHPGRSYESSRHPEDEIAVLSDLQKECSKIVMQNMNLLEPAEAPEEIPEMRRELYATPNAVIERPIPPRYLGTNGN